MCAAKASQGKPPTLGSTINVLKAASKRQYALNTRITWVPRNCIPRLSSIDTPFIKSRTPVKEIFFNDGIILTTHNTRSLGYNEATYLLIHYRTIGKANLTIAPSSGGGLEIDWQFRPDRQAYHTWYAWEPVRRAYSRPWYISCNYLAFSLCWLNARTRKMSRYF